MLLGMGQCGIQTQVEFRWKGRCEGSQSCRTLNIHPCSHEPWLWSLTETMQHLESGMPRPDRCLLIVPCSHGTRAGPLLSIRSCGIHPVLQSHKQPFDIFLRKTSIIAQQPLHCLCGPSLGLHSSAQTHRKLSPHGPRSI